MNFKDGNDRFAGNQDKSYNIEFDYKGAQAANKGTWGAWIAYRHLGYFATPAKTWDVIDEGLKGWAIGALVGGKAERFCQGDGAPRATDVSRLFL